jgi:HEAT repeat protein
VSKKTLTNLIILALVVAVAWGVSYYQRGVRAAAVMKDLAQADDYQAYKALRKVGGLGPAATAQAVTLLTAPEDYVRARACVLVGESGQPRYAAQVAPLLADKSPEVQMAAATALGHLAAPDTAASLVGVVQDTQRTTEVRTAAARSLALLASPQAVLPLSAVLQSPAEEKNSALRQALVVALGATPTPEAVQIVAAEVSPAVEKDATVRALAAAALGRSATEISDVPAITAAGKALIAAVQGPEEKDAEVRIAAAHSLGQLSLPAELSEKGHAALDQARTDDNYWVRQAAAGSLK